LDGTKRHQKALKPPSFSKQKQNKQNKMKPQNTIPLLTTVAPAALAVPPIAVLAALGVGLYWLLSSDEQKPKTQASEAAKPSPSPTPHPVIPQPKPAPVIMPIENAAPVLSSPVPVPARPAPVPSTVPVFSASARRVTREDLAEALAYGERAFTRKEAVAAIEALGFRKTAAYKALSADGKFGSLIEFTPDGLMAWRG
jgi:hypothetical protein